MEQIPSILTTIALVIIVTLWVLAPIVLFSILEELRQLNKKI